MDPANSLPAQPQLRPSHLDEAEIHFTPVKSRIAPRVWERKPSTSFLAARSKPRKVWKRFRSSFNSMKALQQLINPDTSGLKESELLFEINTQRNNEGLRGVKRQCLAAQKSSSELEEGEEGTDTSAVRGRSFLETKWESEVSRKRRKLPAVAVGVDERVIVDDMQVEQDDVDMAEIGAAPGGTTSTHDPEATSETPIHIPGSLVFGAAYPDALLGEARRLPTEQCGVIVNIKPVDEVDYEVATTTTTGALVGTGATDNAFDVATADEQQLRPNVVTTPTKTVQDTDITMTAPVQLTVEQESTLVRSALRSSLGGEDTELLNNFLSKAKAKREAKAAAEAEATATATMIAQDPEEKEEPQPQPQSEVIFEIPTPERRVLEDLDTNSPSPQKSPSKPVEKGENADENSSASPVARRSTRVRSLQRATAPNAFRTTLSLRRAKGTEFVFVKRTEAQELALETKRNTQRNKGESLLPKATLQNLSRQTSDASPTSENGSQRPADKPKKNVSWNDERLVEFEGDASDNETTSQGAKATSAKSPEKKTAASSRNSRSQTSLANGGEQAAATATTASPTAAPRGRRVRRLGPPKPLDSTSFDPSTASSPLSPTTASPIAKRKKLTPKSPKSMLPKAPSTVNTTSERPSLLSAGRSVKTNLLKVNAGSTPMPRRVRRT
ncbi:hypothetical protein BJY00DRAFT_276588 [Aspergillus carlsbadensis]|nr:hypothetical protein BJY00DRAFT_276588 [Aspergillus carlsbadensis]